MTDFRDLCANLLWQIELYTGLDPAASKMSSCEKTERLMDAMAATRSALATPPPKPPTDIERNSARYQWIKAKTNITLSSTHTWWIESETGRKYWPTHDLDVNGSRFSGREHLDDLMDEAMEMYP